MVNLVCIFHSTIVHKLQLEHFPTASAGIQSIVLCLGFPHLKFFHTFCFTLFSSNFYLSLLTIYWKSYNYVNVLSSFLNLSVHLKQKSNSRILHFSWATLTSKTERHLPILKISYNLNPISMLKLSTWHLIYMMMKHMYSTWYKLNEPILKLRHSNSEQSQLKFMSITWFQLRKLIIIVISS